MPRAPYHVAVRPNGANDRHMACAFAIPTGTETVIDLADDGERMHLLGRHGRVFDQGDLDADLTRAIRTHLIRNSIHEVTP